MTVKEKKELNLAVRMRAKEELEMENPMKDQTESIEKLLCPKAGILVQTRRRPHIG
jgi:hypothetical protein